MLFFLRISTYDHLMHSSSLSFVTCVGSQCWRMRSLFRKEIPLEKRSKHLWNKYCDMIQLLIVGDNFVASIRSNHFMRNGGIEEEKLWQSCCYNSSPDNAVAGFDNIVLGVLWIIVIHLREVNAELIFCMVNWHRCV